MKVTLEDIQAARKTIEKLILRTPLEKARSRQGLFGTELFFKFENRQITGSFKIRGASNRIAHLSQDEKKRGVIASSAGNHAQGVAQSAALSNIAATIVMPKRAPLVKINATKSFGANVILEGEIYDEAFAFAQKLAQEKNLVFVHPYQDPLVIAGQGTIGLEIFEDASDLDSLVVPIGGGGLISGIAIAAKALNPKIKIYGVQSEQASGMKSLFDHQTPNEIPVITTIADGIAVKKPSPLMYEHFISKYVDDIVTVSDQDISEAIVHLMETEKTVTEGSGAAGFAAVMKGKLKVGAKTGVVLCGGNIDMNIVAKVIEKGLVAKGRVAQLTVVVNDLPGQLARLTNWIGEQGVNILEVRHDRLAHDLYLRQTRIEFVLETTSHTHVADLKNFLMKQGVQVLEN